MTLHWAGKHCATNNYIRKRASDMTGALRSRIQNGNLTMRNSGSLTPRTPGSVLPLHPTIWKPVRSYSGGWRWGWGCVLLVKACLFPASSFFLVGSWPKRKYQNDVIAITSPSPSLSTSVIPGETWWTMPGKSSPPAVSAQADMCSLTLVYLAQNSVPSTAEIYSMFGLVKSQIHNRSLSGPKPFST